MQLGTKPLAIMILILSSNAHFAQYEISGSVTDAASNSLAYANVIALSLPDSVFVKGTATDELGDFKMSVPSSFNGILKASSIGYSEVTREFKPGIKDYSFTLSEFSGNLDEITLLARKPLYERKPDRVVINIQNSITSITGSALDVLDKSPGVQINRQNNSIIMSGKSGVRIMINNRMTEMPLEAVVQMLSGMSASNIENIELITNPSAKYAAEGNAGIIHIVLVENAEIGTNGKIDIGAGYNTGPTLSFNGNLNRRSEKANLFLNYNIRSDEVEGSWYNRNEIQQENFLSINENKIDRTNTETVQNLRAGIEFPVSAKTNASVLLTGYSRRWVQDAVNAGFNFVRMDSTVFFQGTIEEKNHWQSVTGGFALEHSFNDKNKLIMSYDYLFYENDQPTEFDNIFQFEESGETKREKISVSKKTPINISVAKIDYSFRIDNFTMDMGGKLSISNFENDVEVRRTQQSISEIDPDFSVSATLDEQILGVYINSEHAINERLKLTAGARYEHTITDVSTKEEGTVVDRNFGNIFPSATLNYQINAKKSIGFSYGSRITRPTYNDLAPFVFFLNPTTFLTGNSNLRPAISQNMEASFNTKKWWLAIQYSDIKNSIVGFQPILNEETNFVTYQTQNLEYLRLLNVQFNLPIKMNKWLQWQNDFFVNYFKLKNKNDVVLEREYDNITFNYTGTMSFFLPKDYTLELNGYYNSNTYWGSLEFQPYGQVDLGIKKRFKNDWGEISITGSDLFNTYVWNANLLKDLSRDFNSTFKYTFGIRGFMVNYSLPLGNRKLKGVSIETGSEEERGRVN